MKSNSYGESPIDLPKGLTQLSKSYFAKATIAIFAVILFFILYSALVAAFAYLVYLAVIFPLPAIHFLTILLKIGAIAGAGMLFLFSLKFLLSIKNLKPENRIKLVKSEHPELIQFIDRICEETGAPKPKSIFLDPDVNAYVAYTNVWLSLLLPVKKDLTIGMGLVASLNKSEFKAVISHEFGHFAQRSMKIGSYIMSANTIIHNMIYTRDKWDDLLQQWRNTDMRLSIAAWLITPVIFIIRQILALFYVFLNFMYSQLSREMEFNADKVAVSTAGSEAIVSALWKLELGHEIWNHCMQNAYLATQKEIYVKNLYHENDRLLQNKQEKITELFNALQPDERGGKLFFQTDENSKVSMYATHPPNHLREKNAKTPFIPCPQDKTTSWDFFHNIEQLQNEMTAIIYQKYFNKRPNKYTEDDAFIQFIEAEQQGNDLMKEYLHTFNDRFFNTPKNEDLRPALSDNLSNDLDKLKATLADLMAPIKEIDLIIEKAQKIGEGVSTEKAFQYNGKTYRKRKLEVGFKLMVEERQKLLENNFLEWDKDFCQIQLAFAKQNGQLDTIRLLFIQQGKISAFYRAIVTSIDIIFKRFIRLQQKGEVTLTEIIDLKNFINDKMKMLNTELNKMDTIDFIPLPNIETTQELKKALFEENEFPILTSKLFENGEFNTMIELLNQTTMHCHRVEQKNLAYILQLQQNN